MGILFVFILVLIPLIYLYNYFKILEKERDRVSEELVKERLVNEMDAYKEALKPEIYIKQAFDDLERYHKFPDLDSPEYKFIFDESHEPDYVKPDFINKSENFLKERYGIVPYIFISSGYDFTNTLINVRDIFFPSHREKENFVIAFLGAALYRSNKSSQQVEPTFNKHKASLNELFKRIYRLRSLGGAIIPLNDSFAFQFAKYVSLFSDDIGKPKECSAFFANKFGNQYAYQIYNSLLLKKKNSKFNMLGLYYACIKSSDISIEKLIESACKNQSPINKSIQREILPEKITKPNWEINENSIKYKTPFPMQVYNFVSNHRAFDEQKYELWHKYLQNNVIAVKIDKKHIINNYRYYKDITKNLIYFTLAIFLIILINNSFELIKPRFALSLKVRLIVFISVIIPIIGLWLISQINIKNEENLLFNNIEDIIEERLALFDKLKNDYNNAVTLDFLEYKKLFADNYFYSTTPEYFYKKSESQNFMPILSDKSNTIKRSILLDRSGKTLQYHASNNSSNIKFLSILTLYRIMSDMNLLDGSTKENRKNQENYQLLSSYIDSYEQAYNNKNILALESRMIPEKKLTVGHNVVYNLLAPKNQPNNPQALIYNNIYSYSILDKLEESINSDYSELLDQQSDLIQIKYAIFERNESDFFEKRKQNNSPIFRQLLLQSARKAITKKNSGSEIEEKENSYHLKVWRYYSDSTIIFVASAIIPKIQNMDYLKKMITLILFIYAILAVALLSDLLSDALLSPIACLYKFVKAISLGHINVKATIETSDELQELSSSFNKMSEGLQERENLKRFVSDRLYKSLENKNDQKITKTKVTILSSDIRNFTTITEKNSPKAVVSLLNSYFTLMEASIVKYGGAIEKIVGDAISAAFYEEGSKEHALNACKAAIEIRHNLKAFNEERKEKGLFTIENGIGLATDHVMIGFAGKKARRREFLLIGKVVKLAEQLESMTKSAISSKIYIDKATYEKVSGRIALCSNNSSSEQIFYRELQL